MSSNNFAYEMPFDTEDSYKAKLESGDMIQVRSYCPKDLWIPYYYFED